MMMRAISELDKRMQMFTITEVLSRLETGQGFTPRTVVPAPAPKSAKKEAPPPVTIKSEETKAEPSSKPPIDAVAEASGTDQPWREKMREKYGLKKKPGKV
jgi:hypothetical protein